MIKPICISCKKELNEFGAILISPPLALGTFEKYHICIECYKKLKEYLLKEAV